jgi:2-polyprenyl-6-methoxyphenol hydroxylase-like FAD-dependent oxidoreductase
VHQRRGSAVVCGASLGGLFAARVLSDVYESVTLVERDELPEKAIQRRGVSQGKHLHMLLSHGSSALADLFPGLWDELAAAGADVVDGTKPAQIYMRVAEQELAQSGELADPEAMILCSASRPLLEAHVRRRVRAIENVTIVDGHDVVEPILGQSDRVTAVRVAHRGTAEERVIEADLVVDATGRSARTPAFLEAHGYGRPVEQKYAVNLNYSSQFFEVPAGLLAEKIAVVAPTLQKSTGAGLLAYENGTAILTLIGVAGRRLPTDLPGVMAFAAELMPAHITAALRAAEPLGDVTAQHYPASVWRRYDKLDRFPKGFLVIGDAICSFNPVYGQGMTSAVLQAKALRRCLANADADDLSGQFFRRAAKIVRPIWLSNRLNDYAVEPADGWRAIPKRLLDWYTSRMMAVAAHDVAVFEAFLRTLHLIDPPNRLMHPALVMRIIVGVRRRSSLHP